MNLDPFLVWTLTSVNFLFMIFHQQLCVFFFWIWNTCAHWVLEVPIWLQELKFFIIYKTIFFSDTLGFLQTIGLMFWPLNSANLSLSSVVTLEWICKNKRAAASAMLHAGKINVFLFYCSVSWLMKFWQRNIFFLKSAQPVRNLAQHNVLHPFFCFKIFPRIHFEILTTDMNQKINSVKKRLALEETKTF